MKVLVGAALLATVAAAAHGQTSFSVVNSGATAYSIDGILNPPIDLERGKTYTFNVNATNHPFYIKTMRTTGTGNQYTSGVTGQGATSSALVFVVPLDAPDILYYQCSVHSSMGGTLNIVGPLDVPPGGSPDVAWIASAIPNPARETALFRFGLPREAAIEFSVFDVRGREIRRLRHATLPAGEHLVPWDGRDLEGNRVPSGLYFYRLRVEDRLLGGRVVMTR